MLPKFSFTKRDPDLFWIVPVIVQLQCFVIDYSFFIVYDAIHTDACL